MRKLSSVKWFCIQHLLNCIKYIVVLNYSKLWLVAYQAGVIAACITAVSYTHLDVYKRQVHKLQTLLFWRYCLAIAAFFRFLFWNTQIFSSPIVFDENEVFIKNSFNSSQSLSLRCHWCRRRTRSVEAVSYTHLDVYKRQLQHYVADGNAQPSCDRLLVTVPVAWIFQCSQGVDDIKRLRHRGRDRRSLKLISSISKAHCWSNFTA